MVALDKQSAIRIDELDFHPHENVVRRKIEAGPCLMLTEQRRKNCPKHHMGKSSRSQSAIAAPVTRRIREYSKLKTR